MRLRTGFPSIVIIGTPFTDSTLYECPAANELAGNMICAAANTSNAEIAVVLFFIGFLF